GNHVAHVPRLSPAGRPARPLEFVVHQENRRALGQGKSSWRFSRASAEGSRPFRAGGPGGGVEPERERPRRSASGRLPRPNLAGIGPAGRAQVLAYRTLTQERSDEPASQV